MEGVTKNVEEITAVLRANVALKEKQIGFDRPSPANAQSPIEALE
ncbi:MAG: hypothetical protein ACJ04O_09155 [Cellvibrionales bacterium]|nr:hypothetical protein [Porticoccaceae bacterium]